MTNRLQQLLAASALVVFCERLAREGKLAERDETFLRELTVKVCRAFEIPTLAERPVANSNNDPDYQLASVAGVMKEDQPA